MKKILALILAAALAVAALAGCTKPADNGGNDIVAANPVMAYDAYFVALEAVKIAGSTKGSDIKKALPKVRYNGITGLIEFNETGDAKRDVAYVKHANNKSGLWEFVAIQSVK